ncbi:MAG: glycosyltransferase [Rickettsiales bacterium TMED289]|nr:MAG: glycosyltransferase [Rickettsiales bacterium TMED289]
MTGRCIISFDCESKWGMADNLSFLHEEKLTEDNLILIYKDLIIILDSYNFPATFAFVGALTMSPKYFLDNWYDQLKSSPSHAKWLKKFFQDVDNKNLTGWFCPELLNIVSRSSMSHEICSHGFTHLAWKSATPESLEIEARGIEDWSQQNNIKPTSFIFPRNQVGNRAFLNKINVKGYRDQPKYLSSSSIIPRIKALISEFNIYPNSQHHNFYKNFIAIPGGFFLNWRSGLRKLIPITYSVMRFKNALNHAAKNNGTINLWSHPHNFITGRKQFIFFKKCMIALKEKVDSGDINVLTQAEYLLEIETAKKSLNPLLDSVSIVIPVSGGVQFLHELIQAIKLQTYTPSEIIFIISRVDDYEKISSILSSETELNIFFKVIDPAYPGKARNIGAKMSSSKWLAFLDLRTVPCPEWLEKMICGAILNDAQFVGAKMICSSDSSFTEYLKAATFGNSSAPCLPGSIVLNETFKNTRGFLANVRAGEDWEWIKRITKNVRSSWTEQIVISYKGLPSNLYDTTKKWLRYSIENSKVNILFKEKFFYVSLIFIFFAIFLYRWNHIISGDTWDINNPLFIPNLNKIFWFILISLYILFRGIIKPLKNNTSLHFLLPYKWFLIAILGAIIDITKAPGRILGFFSYIKTKKNSLNEL